MSRKTTIMKRKIAQARSKGKDVHVLFPTGIAKSTGRKTRLASVLVDEDGKATTKRVPGVATGAICTQPMKTVKQARLLKLK